MSGRRAREVRRRKAEMVQELRAGGWATRCVWRWVRRRIRRSRDLARFLRADTRPALRAVDPFLTPTLAPMQWDFTTRRVRPVTDLTPNLIAETPNA